jgi:hypothetical protein
MKSTRRVRSKKRTRRGGKKLGEGKHGFVIDPAIPCKGKDTTGYVSKVFKDQAMFDAVKRNPVFTELKKIDPNQESFLYPETCDTFGDLSEEHVKDGVTEEIKKQSYLMKRGGISLKDEFLLKSTEFLPLIVASKKKPTNAVIDQIVSKALNYLTPIVAGVREQLKKLHDGGILHRDFHAGNVLRMDDGTFRIIDFDSARMMGPNDKQQTLNDENSFVNDAATMIISGNKNSQDLDVRILQTKVAMRIFEEL